MTLLLSITTNAQYTGVINANNPGFAETPYSVGLGVYQFESNFFIRDTSREPVFASPDSNGFQLQYRMSYFYEKLEFIANLGFQNDEITFTNIFNSRYFTQGLSSFSLGAKYLLFEQQYKDKSKEIRSWKKRHAFDWRRLLPSVAAYGGFNTNLVNTNHQRESITGRAGLLFQNDINSDFNIVTNVFYDYIGSKQTELSLVVSGTYSLTDRWSTFLEYQNIFREFVNDVNFGTGLAFLYNRNIQINSSVRYLIEGDAKGYYASFGVSYRLDRHKDALVEYDEVGNKVTRKGNKNSLDDLKDKGKVGKVLDKLNIFKKDPAKRKIKLNQKTIQSIERNVGVDDNTLYNKRKEKGLPIRTRPKRVRKKPSRLKPIKKKKDPALKDEARKKKQQAKDERKKAKEKERQKREEEKAARKNAKQKKKKDTEDEKEDNN